MLLNQDQVADCLFKCKIEINGKQQHYKLKVMPFIEAIPTMCAWASLQRNIMVCKLFKINVDLKLAVFLRSKMRLYYKIYRT